MAEKGPPNDNEDMQGAEKSEKDKPPRDLDLSGDEEEARKRQRQNSPSPSPRFSYSPTASPHKHATFEELLAAAGRIQKLSLAHEVVTNDNFKLSPRKIPENTVQKAVHDMMHKAFWDMFTAEVEADPPIFDRAIRLLAEIKERLFLLLLPRHERLKTQINEVLDLDLIRQQGVNGALNVSHYSEFIISVMAKLCAPVRDEEISRLKSVEGVVPLYREIYHVLELMQVDMANFAPDSHEPHLKRQSVEEIFRVLELMQVDMANFALDSIKPHLKQQSVEYEREQFDQILKTQKDGLVYTRKWLRDVKDRLAASLPSASPQKGPDSSLQHSSSQSVDSPDLAQGSSVAAGGDSPRSPQERTISPLLLLNHAYIGLLDWELQDFHRYPETVLTDRERFLELGSQLRKACLIASVLLVTYTNVGPALSGIQGFPSKLKHGISAIVADVSDFKGIIPNIAEQVCSDVSTHLTEHKLPEMKPEQMAALKEQILSLGQADNSVSKLIGSRAREFLLASISCPAGSDLVSKIPASLRTLQRQLLEIGGMYSRLIRHNRAVYGPYYSKILAELLKLPR